MDSHTSADEPRHTETTHRVATILPFKDQVLHIMLSIHLYRGPPTFCFDLFEASSLSIVFFAGGAWHFGTVGSMSKVALKDELRCPNVYPFPIEIAPLEIKCTGFWAFPCILNNGMRGIMSHGIPRELALELG